MELDSGNHQVFIHPSHVHSKPTTFPRQTAAADATTHHSNLFLRGVDGRAHFVQQLHLPDAIMLSTRLVNPPRRSAGLVGDARSLHWHGFWRPTRGAAAATAATPISQAGVGAAAGPNSSPTSPLVHHLTTASSSSSSTSTTTTTSSSSDPLLALLPAPLAEPLAYVKALTQVLGRQAAEAALDAAASISVQLAEQPARLTALQAEVEALAQRELAASGNASSQQRLLTATSSASSGGSGASSSSSSSSGPGRSQPQDLATIVDELRADIAASRSLLQQLRLMGGGGGGSGAAGGSAGAGGRPAVSSRQ